MATGLERHMCVCVCFCGLGQRCAVLRAGSRCISLWSEDVCPASGLSIRSQPLKLKGNKQQEEKRGARVREKTHH